MAHSLIFQLRKNASAATVTEAILEQANRCFEEAENRASGPYGHELDMQAHVSQLKKRGAELVEIAKHLDRLTY